MPATIFDILNILGNILGTLLPFLISAGVVFFVWGVVAYVIGSDEEAKTKGRDRMIYGIIGLVVIVGIWGLVNIVLNTFGLDNNIPQNIVPNTSGLVVNGPCNQTTQNVGDLLCRLGNIINSIIPFLIAVGVIIFVWGVVAYVIGSDEEAKTKGRDRMIYGIIGLAVIASLWGLVNVVISTFNLDNSSAAGQFLQQTATIGSGSKGCGGLPATGATLADLFGFATCLITRSIIPLILALAVLLFVWGIVQYVISAGNEEQKDRGRQYMIWGIIALTVMISVWGIVRILGNTVNIDYAIPQVKSQ